MGALSHEDLMNSSSLEGCTFDKEQLETLLPLFNALVRHELDIREFEAAAEKALAEAGLPLVRPEQKQA